MGLASEVAVVEFMDLQNARSKSDHTDSTTNSQLATETIKKQEEEEDALHQDIQGQERGIVNSRRRR